MSFGGVFVSGSVASRFMSLRKSLLMFVFLAFIINAPIAALGDINNSNDLPSIHTSFWVAEGVPIGTLVGIVNGPDYGPPYSSWIQTGISKVTLDSFYVDLTRGEIFTTSMLDREELASHNIVLSTDSVPPRMVIVNIRILDVNDNVPKFQHKHWTQVLPEMIPLGVYFTLGYVTDADEGPNGIMTVEIVSGNDHDAFSVRTRDSNDGDKIVDLTINNEIDFEERRTYDLVIKATDGGGGYDTMQVTVNIQDLNDNAPVFQYNSYTTQISDNIPIGSKVITVAAIDRDSGRNAMITYSIDPTTDPEGYFNIDPATGTVRVIKMVGDVPTLKRFALTLQARDNGTPSRTSTVGLEVIVLSSKQR